MPGIAAAVVIACLGYLASHSLGFAAFSPAAAAYLIGAVIRSSAGPHDSFATGLAFSQTKVLRFGIVLLGFQLNAPLLVDLGLPKAIAVLAAMAATLCATAVMARLLGVSKTLSGLIAVGTAVCGASAIAAAAPLLRPSERECGYAVATVTLLGSLLTLVYPLIARVLTLSDAGYGFWAGASLHETAHAVSAGFAVSRQAGQAATVVKLLRVAMLAPMLLMAVRFFSDNARSSETEVPGVPVFLLFFVAAVLWATVLPIDRLLQSRLAIASQAAVCTAMAAIGLRTDIRAVIGAGSRPFLLAVAAGLTLNVLTLLAALVLEPKVVGHSALHGVAAYSIAEER
jgi:uncharacterized integral membrane protein (TIGR00698 family)